MRKRIAIAITTFMNPRRLSILLNNMEWAGWPEIETIVTIDAPPNGWGANHGVMELYESVIQSFPQVTRTHIMPRWGCMQGSIQESFEVLEDYDWIIYVPDDVLFTKGGLFNEYAGVLVYGHDYVGGIQAPYWNADELASMGVMPEKTCMNNPNWRPEGIPQNPHWNGEGLPRTYVNLNGAGFSLQRRVWEKMGGFPKDCWRLDEYAGFMSWKLGFVCLTLPGQPRIHYFGATTMDETVPTGLQYHSNEAWEKATGYTVEQSGLISREIMSSWGGDGREITTLIMPNDEVTQ